MEYRTKIGNRMMTDTPDELYGKIIGIVAGLPEDATWPLPALIIPLQDRMEDENFHIPPLHGLTTKTLQLGTLCLVRSAVAASCRLLNDEEKCLHRLLSNNNNLKGHLNL